MRQLPTVHALALAHTNRVHKLWEGLGYYTRVRNMKSTARLLVKNHGGKFPRRFDKILELPGIGRYTAGAICSIAFNQPYPVLDGNVTRVLTRAFGIEGNPRAPRTNARLWDLAEDLVRTAAKLSAPPGLKSREKSSVSNLNQALMELGALVCTARKPKCELCPLAGCCVALEQDRIEGLPTPIPRAQITKRHVAAFVLEHQGRLLVRQRPADIVNAHLWEFPNRELNSEHCDIGKAAQEEISVPAVLERFCTIQHSITRFRITLDVYRARVPNGMPPSPAAGARWLSRATLEQLPFASAHKRILQKLKADEAFSATT